MKKLLVIVTAALLIFTVGGCGQKEEMQAKEVFTKAAEAAEELSSFSMEFDMEQDITSGEESMKMTTKVDADLTVEPLSMHQMMEMTMPMMDTPVKAEMYLAEAGFFIHEPTSNTWMKMPVELQDQILSMSDMQQDPSQEFERLKPFADDFSLEEKEDTYVLSVSSAGEKFQEFIKQSITEVMPELADDAIFNDVTYNQMDYTIVINKETFYPVSLEMMLDFQVKEGEQDTQMVMNVTGAYSNYNEIEPITVPEEVVNQAQEMPNMPAEPLQ